MERSVVIQVDDDDDDYDQRPLRDCGMYHDLCHSTGGQTSRTHNSQTEFERAKLNLKYVADRAELDTQEIELLRRDLEVKRRLQAAKIDFAMKEFELRNKGASAKSSKSLSVDSCSRREFDKYSDSCELKPQVPTYKEKVESWMKTQPGPDCEPNAQCRTQYPNVLGPGGNAMPVAFAYGPGLPEFKIDTFSGKPADWPEWYLSFKNLIHENPVLTDGQKLGYLRTYLGPEPRSKVFGLLLDASHYGQAMTELKNRYGNPALVIDDFIRRIRKWPNVRKVSDLPEYYTKVSQLYQMFKTMGYEADLKGKGLLSDLTDKIPDNMQEAWGRYVVTKGKGNPTVELFYNWLKEREEALRFTSLSAPQNEPKTDPKSKPNVKTLATDARVKQHCVFCEGDNHWVDGCAKFLAKSPPDRLAWYKTTGRCFLCSKTTHRSSGCFLKVRCSNCGKSHATMLHDAFQRPKSAPEQSTAVSSKDSKDPKFGVGVMNRVSSKVFLQTLPVKIHTPSGRIVETCAILDSGSQATLIQESFARDIGLNGPVSKLHVSGINDNGSQHRSKRLTFWVSNPVDRNQPLLKVNEAWTFDRPFNFPSRDASGEFTWPHVTDLNLRSVDSSEIMLLIGANVAHAHRQLEVREGPENLPIVVKTPLGWTAMGVDCSDHDSITDSLHLSINHAQIQSCDLEKKVERFWETENYGCKSESDKPYSLEDKRAEQILESTLRVTESGHFEVGMLWAESPPKLVNNRKLAEHQFNQTRKRLRKDLNKCGRYKNTVNGYITSGFARKMTPHEASQVTSQTYYLPHHAVINPKKPEKLRVVYNAASVYANSCLNDHLLTGPDLINNLIGVLMRFRCGSIAISADIMSMFHMVFVPKLFDADSLRFFWTEHPESDAPADVYQMLVHIFGAKSSPCCANYCLKRCALDNRGGDFSEEAITTVLRNFYVDDMCKAVDSVPHAIRLALELIKLTGTRGFKLTKWSSNNQDVLNAIENLDPDLDISTSVNLEMVEKSHNCRTLGMNCDMKRDVFFFESVSVENARTKREILSIASSIFDPLGLLSPFVLKAKLFLQSLWEKRLGWDDILTDEDLRLWLKWCSELQELSNICIPRCYWPLNFEHRTYVLHTFCDASEAAFAACVYLVVTSQNGDSHVSLVLSKTRVAPVKKRCLTLPRLELQAAVLGVRLHRTVIAELDLDISDSFFWTDSLIVLQYINSESKRLKTFVANRVSEIRASSNPEQWKFVPGNLNPADDCSRGLSLSQLNANHRWFNGPEFLLSNDPNDWPVQVHVPEVEVNDSELKRVVIAQSAFVHQGLVDVSEFSRLSRLLRVTAWSSRFVHNAKPQSDSRTGRLTVPELDGARLYWVKQAQSEYFAEEIAALASGKPISRNSRLKSLTPILVDGVLRVGGRLKHARIPFDSKHQVIIPHQHPIAKLLILEAHRNVNHEGPEHTIAELRQTYWITRVRTRVRMVIHDCFLCRLRRICARVPKMAQLPLARVHMGSVWSTTMCDYFGPLSVKRGRGREKRWVCIFTSLTVRAIHLEIAASLDTDAFIMALRRFIARRGKPKDLYCDNGTNFVGANSELKEALKSLDTGRIHDFLAEKGTEFHFSPPKGQHMNGAVERLVKSVKRSLDVVLRSHCVFEDTLHTFLCEVESILNSRPLTHVSTDPRDPEPLTPAHFLLGIASDASAIVQSSESDICSRKRWRHTQLLADHFWNRWRKEYLPSLTVTRKWTEEVPNLKVDDVVLINDNNEARGRWPLARVVEICPSSDGRVRVVKVKTPSGVLTRPVARLCLLEEAKRS